MTEKIREALTKAKARAGEFELEEVTTGLDIAGAALVVVGVALIYLPAALILAGAALLLISRKATRSSATAQS